MHKYKQYYNISSILYRRILNGLYEDKYMCLYLIEFWIYDMHKAQDTIVCIWDKFNF